MLRHGRWLAAAAVTGIVCAFAFRGLDVTGLRAALAGASVGPLVLAMVLDLALRNAARTRRTFVVLHAVSPARIRFVDLLSLVLAGRAAGSLIPGPSEEAVHTVALKRLGFRLSDLLVGQAIEKALSLFCSAVLTFLFMPPVAVPRVPLAVGMAVVAAFALRQIQVRRGLPLAPALEAFGQVLASNLLCAVMMWLAFLSVGIHPGIAACIGISCVTACANVVSLLPGQFGLLESAFVLAAKQLGVASGQALAVALLYHATHLIPVLLGALIASLRWRSFAGAASPTATPSWRSTPCAP